MKKPPTYGRDLCLHPRFRRPGQWAIDARMSGILTQCRACGQDVISAPFDERCYDTLHLADPALAIVVEVEKAPVGCRDPVAWFRHTRWDRGKWHPGGIIPPQWGVCPHRLHTCTPTSPTPAAHPAGGHQLSMDLERI